MSGETLGRFEILDKLGEGGMGVLYRARDTRLGRTVAIKLLHPEVVADPERTRRFLQEARAASALNHPNIVTVHDIGEDPERGTWIAMECLEGESLRQRLARGPLPCRRRCASRSRSPAASPPPTRPASSTATSSPRT